MTKAPTLLYCEEGNQLPRELVSDLRLDSILSKKALEVLKNPCNKTEIFLRQELFSHLENYDFCQRIQVCLSQLKAYQHTRELLRDSHIPLERLYLQQSTLSQYVEICQCLSSFFDGGELLSAVSTYYGTPEKQRLYTEMQNDKERIEALLKPLSSGLLSFSEKHWITPDKEITDEFDEVANCAQNLGFTVSSQKAHRIHIPKTLSDGICRLHKETVTQIETILSKYESVNFAELFSYIAEIQFFLEIRELTHKAKEAGIAVCLPSIASDRRFTAQGMSDISLLSPNCKKIIPNDADFSENEPFFFLIGANGGGKTTYLRAVGINLTLFLAGCPIFAKEASIYPFTFVSSHFPKDERFDFVGRLDEEQNRVEEMLILSAGKDAFLLFNETFSGADKHRGFDLLQSAGDRIRKEGYFGLYVTHFHEVMNTGVPVLSAQVDEENHNLRTFRIVKVKGTASSYAADILKKYGLDKESLKKRRGAL